MPSEQGSSSNGIDLFQDETPFLSPETDTNRASPTVILFLVLGGLLFLIWFAAGVLRHSDPAYSAGYDMGKTTGRFDAARVDRHRKPDATPYISEYGDRRDLFPSDKSKREKYWKGFVEGYAIGFKQRQREIWKD